MNFASCFYKPIVSLVLMVSLWKMILFSHAASVPQIIRINSKIFSKPKMCSAGQSQLGLLASITAKTSSTNLAWSQPASWTAGVVPKVGDEVIIPDGAKILVDQDVKLKSISVMGTLTFDRTKDLNVSVEHIMVMGTNALFECGSEDNPYQKNAVITLVGNDATAMIPGHGVNSKSIMVMNGGRLELHGKQKTSWLKINKTANIGDNTITLSNPVSSWTKGDSIVIASTDKNYKSAEVRAIKDIVGTLITLDRPLLNKHFGEILTFNQTNKTFDQRAEVGLLTRNIKIQGEFVATTPAGFGGHMMVMPGSQAHVENVELHRMGQFNQLGRYPFHWHICGDVAGQYFKNSTIKYSSNRALTVHGSNNALIEGNVAYQHIGHGFFLEDGDEEGNIFRNNLGLSTIAPPVGKELDAGDNDPSTFWITNPNNSYIGNVAAGGEGTGFWIIPLRTLLRTGATLSKGGVPRQYPLKKFLDNTGHSNPSRNIAIDGDVVLKGGKRIENALDAGGYPIIDINGDTMRYILENFVSYKGGSNGAWTRVGLDHRFINARFGDAGQMAFLAFNGYVENSMFVASSKNTGAGGNYEYNEILGLQMYNGSCDAINVHLAGFTDETKVCIGNRRSSGKYPNFTATGITFENDGTQDNKVNLGFFTPIEDPARSYCFAAGMIDLDGSITGQAGVRLTPMIRNTYRQKTSAEYLANKIFDVNFNQPKQLNRRVTGLPASWNAVGSKNTEFALFMNFFSFPSDGAEGDNLNAVYGMRSDGPVVYDELHSSKNSQWPVIVNEDYVYNYQLHRLPNSFRSEFKWSKTKNSSVMVKYLNIPSNIKIEQVLNSRAAGLRPMNVALSPVADLNTLKASTKTAFYLKNNTLHVKYVATEKDEGLNTSVRYNDYSSDDLEMNFNPTNIASVAGGLDYVTLADFEVGIDDRAIIKTLGSVITSSITGNGINPSDAIDHKNSFSITKATANTVGYAEYYLKTSRQIWREFNTLSLNYSGPNVEVLVVDSLQGDYSLGNFKASDSRNIDMSMLPDNYGEEVLGLKLRFNDCVLTTTAQTVDLLGITLSLIPTSTPSATNSIGATCISTLNKLWHFKTDLEGWVGNSSTQTTVSNSILDAKVIGVDPFLTSPLLNISAADMKYVHIRAKNNSASTTGEVYFTTNTSPGINTIKKVSFAITPNDTKYREYIIDMSANPEWKDIVTQLRFDPTSSSTGSVQIDLIEISNTNQIDCSGTLGGSAYLDFCGTCVAGNTGKTACLKTFWEYATNGDAELWAIARGLDGEVLNGSQKLTVTNIDPQYWSPRFLQIPALEYPYLRFRIKSALAGNLQIYWFNEAPNGLTNATMMSQRVSATGGQFKEVVIDMSKNAQWINAIYQLRIDPEFGDGNSIEIDRISFEKENLLDCNEVWAGPATKPCVITSVDEEVVKEQLMIFPNPSQDGIFNLSQTTNWKVISVVGKELKVGNSNQINLSEYPKGIYLIKINEKLERIVVD